MTRSSIRLRLWSAAAISVVVVLAIAGAGLVYLFERHVERQLETDLIVDLNQLIAESDFANGALTVRQTGVTDPRFAIPLSGYYWEVSDLKTGAVVRSRSLWDASIALPAAFPDGRQHFYEATGPAGALLLVLDRTITDENGGTFRVAVAEDHALVSRAVAGYLHELVPALLLLAAVLSAAFFAQITVGLAPLAALRDSVRSVVRGQRRRLDADAPAEVQPLTAEINRLLEAQDAALGRARARAADLAHGVKTPLQVISADIRTLRDQGHAALADEIEKSAEAIRRHVERALARARVSPQVRSARADVAAVAGRVIDVVRRMPDNERREFRIDVPGGLVAPIDEGDLIELLGNLIENAGRFARMRVTIAAHASEEGTAIVVSDDGPGIPEADRAAALHRGVSLGAGPGTGLGLAIVSDIVESYNGRLTLEDAKPGLAVTIFLPASI